MVSKVLAVLFAVLMLPTVIVVWFQRDVVNTTGYMTIVSPLVDQPQVQAKIADAVAEEVTGHFDVSNLVGAATQDLPPRAASALNALARPLSSAVDTYVKELTEKLVASDAFATVWTGLNKTAHQVLIKGMQHATGDSITIDLGPIVEQVKSRLLSDGFQLASRIPTVNKQLVLVSSPLIAEVSRWYPILRVLTWALPIAALVALAAALVFSKSRFKTLFTAAMGTAIGMLVLTAATYVGHRILAPKTGIAIYDAFAASLRSDIRWVMAISAVVAVLSWVLHRRVTSNPG